MKNLLIVGAGFVGGTAYQLFSTMKSWDVKVYDINPEKSYLASKMPDNLIDWETDKENFDKYDLFMVAVPTPAMENGKCYTGIVESVVSEIREYNKDSWICIKSTVPPGTTQRMNDSYTRVCFNPEFLTEANALFDFYSIEYQIIGYPEYIPGLIDSLDSPIEDLYKAAKEEGVLKSEVFFEVSSTQAELVKYIRNTYLATRLSFFNEIKQVCDALELDYKSTAHLAGLDNRIGTHYNRVDEENRGWGGVCLYKDIVALIHFTKSLNVKPIVLEAVLEKNLEVRSFRDWEEKEGRAVMKKEG